MDRISGAGFALNAAGERVFQDIDQAAGISGTDVVALWLNGVQESILAVVAAATTPALTPTDADNTQLLQAIRQLIAASALGFTPVQQGGGPGQLTNRVQIGWDGGSLRAAVDGNAEGSLISSANLNFFFPTTPTSVALPGGGVLQFFEIGLAVASSGLALFPTAFPTQCLFVSISLGAPFAGGYPPTDQFGASPYRPNGAALNSASQFNWQVNAPSGPGALGFWVIAWGN